MKRKRCSDNKWRRWSETIFRKKKRSESWKQICNRRIPETTTTTTTATTMMQTDVMWGLAQTIPSSSILSQRFFDCEWTFEFRSSLNNCLFPLVFAKNDSSCSRSFTDCYNLEYRNEENEFFVQKLHFWHFHQYWKHFAFEETFNLRILKMGY